MNRFISALVAALSMGSVFAAPVSIRTAAQDNSANKYNLGNAAKPGICVEIIQAIEKQDPEIKFTGQDKPMPLARIESEIAEGLLDGFVGLVRSPERQAKYKFVEPAVFNVKHKVAVRTDDKIELKTLDDLKKAAGDGGVMTTQATAYVGFLEKAGIKVDAGTKNNSDIVKKLVGERGRFFYQVDVNLSEYIEKEKAQDKVRILPATFKEEGQYIVFSKLAPAATVAKVQAAVEKLEKSGELKKIFAKYVK